MSRGGITARIAYKRGLCWLLWVLCQNTRYSNDNVLRNQKPCISDEPGEHRQRLYRHHRQHRKYFFLLLLFLLFVIRRRPIHAGRITRLACPPVTYGT